MNMTDRQASAENMIQYILDMGLLSHWVDGYNRFPGGDDYRTIKAMMRSPDRFMSVVHDTEEAIGMELFR